MPLVLLSSPSSINFQDLRFPKNVHSNPTCTYTSTNYLKTHTISLSNNPITLNLINKSPRTLIKFVSLHRINSSGNGFFGEADDNDWSDVEEYQDVDDEMGSPWEGAIVYQRNASVSHVEYCTTLERLGLGKLSSEVSKSRASLMGLRVTKAVKDFPLGTPVLVSVDVTRKKHKLRLDGIIRTVLTLACYRYCCISAFLTNCICCVLASFVI